MANSESKVVSQSTVWEKSSYGLYFMGQNVFFILLLTFLLPFCTDTGIPVIAVGIIMLAVRVFDAANDPVFGAIVDKSHLKSGKFLPWLRISLFGIPVFTILLFATPSHLPVNIKIAWAATMYTLWSMAYTVCDVPIFGIITSLTSNPHERTSLISIGRVFSTVGGCIAMVVLPLVRQKIGGWFPTTLILSVAAFVMMAPICFIAKERVPPMKGEDITFKRLVSFILKNKYMLIFYGSMILAYGGNIGGSLGMYISRYNLQNESYMAILSVLGFLPGAFIAMLIPAIIKKIDKFNMLLFCLCLTIVLNIAAFFVGYQSVTLFLVFATLKGIAFSGVFILMFMFTPDFAEYGMYKTGISAVGLAFSIQTFAAKLISAIIGVFAAAALSFIGFVEGEGAIQLPGFETKLWFLYYGIPTIMLILSVPLFLCYKPRDKYIAIMARCNKGEITHAEAERMIGIKL